MPGITYTIRFHRRDRRGCIPEEQEYTVLADAWESFRLFAEPDSAETEEQEQEQVAATPQPEPEATTTVKPGYLLPPFFLLFIGALCFMLNRSTKKD
jgi:hypothetical protein